MKPLDILRRATTPMTDAQSAEFVRVHYGLGRENASSDDSVAVKRARAVLEPRKKGRARVKIKASIR